MTETPDSGTGHLPPPGSEEAQIDEAPACRLVFSPEGGAAGGGVHRETGGERGDDQDRERQGGSSPEPCPVGSAKLDEFFFLVPAIQLCPFGCPVDVFEDGGEGFLDGPVQGRLERVVRLSGVVDLLVDGDGAFIQLAEEDQHGPHDLRIDGFQVLRRLSRRGETVLHGIEAGDDPGEQFDDQFVSVVVRLAGAHVRNES